jgi:uncharacterized protein YfaS (alpha-2-macroglobulin family)
MRLRTLRVLTPLLFVWLGLGFAVAQSRGVSFNLSTDKSFAPGEQPTFHLYTRNVDALEFRVYRVNDPVKFIENLRELHSFGPEAGLLAAEQIDERTPLERFHDWKHGIWEDIRYFFKDQFTTETRHQIQDSQGRLTRKSRVLTEAEFAQVPILNPSQLVSRWRLQVPPTFISNKTKMLVPKLGGGLYLLEATDGHYRAYTLLMVSELALVTRATSGHVTAMLVDRVTGAPVAGARVDAGFAQRQLTSATTDASGTAELTVEPRKSQEENFWVVAAKGADVAVTTPSGWGLDEPYGASKYAGYVFTERPVYRPTHTVHWKAILRERHGNVLVLPEARNVHVTIADDAGKAIFDKQMPLAANGEVNGDFDLPKDAALGYYTLTVADSGGIACGFHVEDYRKPEYRVDVKPPEKRILEGGTMPVTIDSNYFFGEPVANAKVKYRVYHAQHYWWGEEEDDTPDNRGSFDPDTASDANRYAGDEESEKTGKLDANGKLVIEVPTQVPNEAGRVASDYDYTIEAGVTDAANREITGRGRFLATYSSFRVHIEPITYAVHAGDTARFRVTTVDYDEKPVSTQVHVQMQYEKFEDGKTKLLPGPAVDVSTDATGQAEAGIAVANPPTSSAVLHASAAAVQAGTRNPMDESYLWIAGAGETGWDSSTETTRIVCDKKSYAVGETAHLSVISETGDFYALVIVEGDSLLKKEMMPTTGKTLAFDLPITPEAMPNLNVSVLFVKDNTVYQATKTIKVPPVQQRLQVRITPAKSQFQPQQSAVYDVLTSDAAGKPVSASLSFGVVDEAIYSLYPDISGDMIQVLYPDRTSIASVDASLDYYFSGQAGSKSPLLAMREARYRPQLAQVKPGNEAKPRVRKANLHTDATGHARVSLTFPDSLTTWRATVHAITASSQGGSTINRVLVRKDVIVRMGTPRFMIKGDEITLPVIAHNYLDTPAQAKISLAVQGLEVAGGTDQMVTIPSKGEATVLWRLHAAQTGSAKLTASAMTAEESDALEISFPVNPSGVAETIARSGVVAPAASQGAAQIVFPAKTDASAHSLRIEVSPSIAGSLFPALNYLTTYPYGCTEQTMSSYLPNVIVADTLTRLKGAGGVDPAGLQAKMEAGLERLKDYQHDDGGWGWWKEDDSRVYMTAYVVGGLGQGFHVKKPTWQYQYMLRRGKGYLVKALAEHPRMRPELRAAVVYALAQSVDGTDSAALRPELDTLWSRRDDLEPEGLAMTGLAMLEVHDGRAAQAATLLAGKAKREGELVYWKGSYVPLLDSIGPNDIEATAFVTRLLARLDANQPLLPGAAQWLMLARNGGIWWDSTEQTAMVLFGLVDYLAASHELEADFSVNVLVNGQPAGERHFTAADAVSGASLTLDVDAGHLRAGTNEVRILRSGGAGRVYWAVRGNYYSEDKRDFQEGTFSLNLTRDYFKLQPAQKDGKVVYTLVALNGTAQVGDVLAVHEAISGSPMRYLLLEDPIPAGVEFIQNEDSYPIEQRPGGWYGWFTRREFHDDHAAFFASDFTGRQEIFYLVRVVNPGSFQISPARVQPMYQHGVQATSDAPRLQVPAPAGGSQ